MKGRTLWVAAMAAAVAAGSVLVLQAKLARSRSQLEDYGALPEFRLVDARARPFTVDSLRSHVTIADFIFTRCTASCPRLTARMAEIQSDIEKLHSDVRLVSFSVDPEYDTPVVLSAYAAHAHADPARWSFVTGPVDDVSRTVVLGFKVSAAKVARKAGDYDVTHGNWLVLVDRECHVRGYYSAEPSDSARLVVDDAVRLERQVR